jgi:hypothetical protein
MSQWEQFVVHEDRNGRIVCMDSVGYVDSRNKITDVLICGSHGAPCATQLAIWLRPRGIICHDAGIGKAEGGVAGLKLLDVYLLPGATVSGETARISDGRDMYENGIISRVNRAAAGLGLKSGISTKDAANLMLTKEPSPVAPAKRQILVQTSENGKVYACDTVKYVDERIEGSVLVMGSHAAPAMASYIFDLKFRLAGVITNDAGMSKDRSGVAGLATLDQASVPAAAVSVHSARMGDAQATYHDGVISAVNRTAKAAGVVIGQRADVAAELMLVQYNGQKKKGE